jgi:ATP-dependent Clp protease protease subunit
MLHQPIGGVGGQATDIAIHAKEIIRIKEALNEILVKHTSQKPELIRRDTDRNFYMDSKEALEYGIIDEILVNRK